MKKYSKWKDEEVIKLFNFIEQGRLENICLTTLFSRYAKSTNRMANSVRNYYYAELNELTKDEKRQKRLGIDLSVHTKCEQQEFSQQETKQLMLDILKQTAKGISVRKACLNLADGDISKMVRFQNKFRTVVLKNKDLYEQCLQELNQKGVAVKKEMPNNVIAFKDKRLLTDSDINSLFLGLVKLVKKQASEEVAQSLKSETDRANSMLRKALVDLGEKENEIKLLRKNFKVVAQENEKLSEEIKLLRGKNAELISKCDKLNALKKFTEKYEKRVKQAKN